MQKNILRDALYNFHPTSGASDNYCKGIIVGVVSGVMAGGVEDWDKAIAIVKDCMPIDARKLTEDNTPESWLPYLSK